MKIVNKGFDKMLYTNIFKFLNSYEYMKEKTTTKRYNPKPIGYSIRKAKEERTQKPSSVEVIASLAQRDPTFFPKVLEFQMKNYSGNNYD